MDAELRSTLAERRLLVLSGARGSGRSTTGLKLLAEFAPGKVRRLAPASDPVEGAIAQIGEAQGYLGELRSTDAIPAEAELDRLADHLATSRAYCVLILPADVPGMVAGVYLREHVPPERFAVLDRRIEADCAREDVARAQHGRRLAEYAKDPQLRAILGPAPGPADEVWLADVLDRLARGEIDRAQALRSDVELVDRHIAAWLADLPQGVDLHRHRDDVSAFAFRLALTVFNDSPVDLVCEAGERLAWELYTTANPRITPGRTVFSRMDEKWLAGSRAALRDGSVTVADAEVSARLLSYQADSVAVRLLASVWGSRPNLRRPMLRWLQDLSQDRRPIVWTRAALALGLTAGWDFAYSFHEVIEVWAGSEILKQRLVAAMALDQASRGPVTGAAVRNVVQEWSNSEEEAKRWTAAAVLGSGAGASDAAAGLRLLRRIGVWKDGRLADVASDCAAELLTRGRLEEVLASADAWIGDTRTNEHYLGLLTVIRLGDLRVRQVPNIDEFPLPAQARTALRDPLRAGWPLIVAVAGYSDRLSARLAECVWQVLSSAVAGDVMRDEVGDWIRAAVQSPDLIDPLSRFLRRLIDDEDDQARLIELVDTMAADPDEPLPEGIARAVSAVIATARTPVDRMPQPTAGR
jgi:hypothetical protein